MIDSVVISNPSPYRSDSLSLSFQSSDADNDALTENIEWYVNQAMVSTTPMLPLASYAVGDEVMAKVTADDGTVSVSMVSDAVIIKTTHRPLIRLAFGFESLHRHGPNRKCDLFR